MVNIVSLGAPTKPKDSRANKDWRAGESGSRASSTDESENTPPGILRLHLFGNPVIAPRFVASAFESRSTARQPTADTRCLLLWAPRMSWL